MNQIAVVAIGRNEGERLRLCLTSVVGRGLTVVYVDSNSTDESVALARAMGAEVVELDLDSPFTMARARNAGYARLREINPEVRFVQFIDGDCELVEGWLEEALAVIENRPEVAVVFGRLHERFPERTIYNQLADLEWDSPIGEAKYCGGNALVRVQALRQVGGYNPVLIAGEEPELCVRLRQHGWTILRIDTDMSRHDAAMTRFSQWWRRSVRAGYAYANGVFLHGKPPERHYVREVRSILLWGFAVPLLTLILIWPTRGASIALLGAYLVLYWRIRRYGARRGWSVANARLYALWCILAKFPMLLGLIFFWLRRTTRRPETIIEHKRLSDSRA
jgi:glycosyltransferase involved in cell wall biosynthesis